MRNMLVVKNVESNLVEEAIVVFKENVKLHEENLIKKNSIKENKNTLKNDLCVKEAEIIVNSYTNKIESNFKEISLKRKIRFLKVINILLVIAVLILAFI